MIYFIREGEYPNTEVKIGYTSSNDISKRLGSLQNGNPRELWECWKIPGDKDIEKLVHRFFKRFRIRGEWFREDDWYDILFHYFNENIRHICESWEHGEYKPDDSIPEIKHWLKSEVST